MAEAPSFRAEPKRRFVISHEHRRLNISILTCFNILNSTLALKCCSVFRTAFVFLMNMLVQSVWEDLHFYCEEIRRVPWRPLSVTVGLFVFTVKVGMCDQRALLWLLLFKLRFWSKLCRWVETWEKSWVPWLCSQESLRIVLWFWAVSLFFKYFWYYH